MQEDPQKMGIFIMNFFFIRYSVFCTLSNVITICLENYKYCMPYIYIYIHGRLFFNYYAQIDIEARYRFTG